MTLRRWLGSRLIMLGARLLGAQLIVPSRVESRIASKRCMCGAFHLYPSDCPLVTRRASRSDWGPS